MWKEPPKKGPPIHFLLSWNIWDGWQMVSISAESRRLVEWAARLCAGNFDDDSDDSVTVWYMGKRNDIQSISKSLGYIGKMTCLCVCCQVILGNCFLFLGCCSYFSICFDWSWAWPVNNALLACFQRFDLKPYEFGEPTSSVWVGRSVGTQQLESCRGLEVLWDFEGHALYYWMKCYWELRLGKT